MANVTLSCSWRVCRMFTQGDDTIVTSATYISGLIMGKRYNQRTPGASSMASLTSIGGQRMGGGFIATGMAAHRGTIGNDGLIVRERQQ